TKTIFAAANTVPTKAPKPSAPAISATGKNVIANPNMTASARGSVEPGSPGQRAFKGRVPGRAGGADRRREPRRLEGGLLGDIGHAHLSLTRRGPLLASPRDLVVDRRHSK